MPLTLSESSLGCHRLSLHSLKTVEMNAFVEPDQTESSLK